MTPTEQQDDQNPQPRPPSRDEPVADGGSNWNRRLSEEEQGELGDDVQGLPPGRSAQEEAALVGDDEKEIPAQEYNDAIESDLDEREERQSFQVQADRELADDAAPLHEDEEITADDPEVEDGPAAPRVRLKPVPNPRSAETKQKQVQRARVRKGQAASTARAKPKPKASPKKKVAAKKVTAKKKAAPRRAVAKKKVTAKKKPVARRSAAAPKRKPAKKSRSRR